MKKLYTNLILLVSILLASTLAKAEESQKNTLQSRSVSTVRQDQLHENIGRLVVFLSLLKAGRGAPSFPVRSHLPLESLEKSKETKKRMTAQVHLEEFKTSTLLEAK